MGDRWLNKIIRPRFPQWRQRPTRLPAQVTALDVDGQSLRIVVMAPRGPRMAVIRLETALLEFPPEADRADPNVLGQSIAKALRQLGFKPHAVVMGVSRAQ